jgi:hypothetical protein
MGPHPGYRNLFQGQECKLPVNNCMMLDAARAALVHELRKKYGVCRGTQVAVQQNQPASGKKVAPDTG